MNENESIPPYKEDDKTSELGKSIVSIQPEKVSPKPEIINMEVHHHPDLHHRKKHWKEYFLEFLMIFLAVTMGFFAENIRESITENAKAKVYAQSLYSDLKEDTSYLNFILQYKTWQGLKMDSLISILSSGDVQNNARLMYYYHSSIETNIPFMPADATIQQLRNSGGLRYFKNPALYSAITKYDGSVNFYNQQEKERIGFIPFNLSSKIYRADILISMEFIADDPRDVVHMPAGNPPLLTTDKQILNEYLLYIINEKHQNQIVLILLHSSVQKSMNELMKTLQKEYNLH